MIRRETTSTRGDNDSGDGIQLNMDKGLSEKVYNDDELLKKVLHAKIVAYYFNHALLAIMVVTSLVAIICSYQNSIWPMMITYVMGTLKIKGTATKVVNHLSKGRGRGEGVGSSNV